MQTKSDSRCVLLVLLVLAAGAVIGEVRIAEVGNGRRLFATSHII